MPKLKYKPSDFTSESFRKSGYLTISIRATKDQLNQITVACGKLGTTRAALIRRLLVDAGVMTANPKLEI